jgi:hypothetical protein
METITQSRARRRKKMVNVEATPEWIAWADGLARHLGMSRSDAFDLALRRLAAKMEYEAEAPKR